jgi:hypothetical protein
MPACHGQRARFWHREGGQDRGKRAGKLQHRDIGAGIAAGELGIGGFACDFTS